MFWYEGRLICDTALELSIDDPGLLYGATVFTTLRVYQQSLSHPLTNWKGHEHRLKSSLQTFGWQQPNWQRLQSGAEKLSESYPVLRIAVFPDGREWIIGRSLPVDLAQRQQKGITAWLADAPEYRRSLASHKTGNYLPAWLAGQAARRVGAGEAILVDAAGNWLETSTGNLWGWHEGCWWIPPLEAGILPGVVRSQLIDWLMLQDYPVKEATWVSTCVFAFDAIAYTNSVMEVIPIHTILTSSESLFYDPCHPSFDHLRSLWQFPRQQFDVLP